MAKRVPTFEPPAWLTAEAKTEWARVLSTGYVLIPGVNETVLAAYCQHYARWRQAEQQLEEQGTELILRNDKGIVKSAGPSPHVGISNKAFDRMLKAAAQLGIKSNSSDTSGPVRLTRAKVEDLIRVVQ